jgi:hypothetical protein
MLSVNGTYGTFSEITETMTTRSCSTPLYLTLARSAGGVVSFVGCGKTAVPVGAGPPAARSSS